MQVTRKDETPCSVVLEFELDVAEVAQGFERAYRQFGQVTNVPGFRPGKAPRAVLERFVDADRARSRAADLVSSKAFEAALKQYELEPYTEAERDGEDIVEGEPWRFRTVVYTAPKVTLGSMDDIAVERSVSPVEDADIDRELKLVQQDYRKATPVQGRGIEVEDAAIAELEVRVEGVDEEPGSRRTLLTFGDNIPGFDEAVLGMEAGEERTFELTYPEDHQEPERAGKQAQFTVRVHSIFRYELPELTDAWVHETLGVENVETLRNLIRLRLERDAAERAADDVEGRIVDQIVQRATVDFPAVMLDAEIVDERARLDTMLRRAGLTMDAYMEQSGLTPEALEEQVRARSEVRVRNGIVLRELARENNVTVTRTEIDEALAALAGDRPESHRRLNRLQRDAETRTDVANRILRAKLRDLLFGKATITDLTKAEPEA